MCLPKVRVFKFDQIIKKFLKKGYSSLGEWSKLGIWELDRKKSAQTPVCAAPGALENVAVLCVILFGVEVVEPQQQESLGCIFTESAGLSSVNFPKRPP